MSVNSKMTAIANATRALDGSTAALTLDGIASKLGVEKTNIAAALAAIAEKGVTVPDGSTSDALASLIASIEAGGGVKMVTGSFTLAEDQTGTMEIIPDVSSLALPGEDDQTLFPKCFVFVSVDRPTTSKGTWGFALFRKDELGTKIGVSGGYNGSSQYNNAYASTINFYHSYGLQLKFGSSDAQIGLAGNTYRYYIWRAYE